MRAHVLSLQKVAVVQGSSGGECAFTCTTTIYSTPLVLGTVLDRGLLIGEVLHADH